MKRSFAVLVCSTLLGFVTGCGQSSAPAPASKSSADTEHQKQEHKPGHEHGAGPHGGTIIDWGGGAYHVEFTVDQDKKEATAYILGSDEKSPAPIKADKIQLFINDPMTELELVAKPLDGEAAGTCSRFIGTHDTIGIVKEFAGTISGVIEDTPYTGDFKEEPHTADQK